MTTHLYNYIESLNNSWQEVDILYNEAIKTITSQIDVHNALCRSISVLIVAHLEGFLKNVAKSFVNDLLSIPFVRLPESIKYQHCTIFLGSKDNSKQYYEKMARLVKNLEQYEEYKILSDAFIYGNSNPKASVIEMYAKGFGCENIFKLLHNSVIDNNVFSGANSARFKRVYRALEWELKRKVNTFPYKIKKGYLLSARRDHNEKTLWELFIENINSNRHAIVHGNEFSNKKSLNELEDDIWKTRIFQLTFILAICQSLYMEEVDLN